MLELLQESIRGFNLPFTLLLGVMIFYWIIALMGVVDLEIGSDLGADFDLDTGTDSDPSATGDDTSGGAMNTLIKIVGLSDAPMILILSLMSLFLWGCNLLANIYFNSEKTMGTASLLLIPVFLVAFIITRILVKPLGPVMRMISGPEADTQVIGVEGIVKSATLNSEFGRVELESGGRTLLIDAILSEGLSTQTKDSKVLVISKHDDSDTYIVRPL